MFSLARPAQMQTPEKITLKLKSHDKMLSITVKSFQLEKLWIVYSSPFVECTFVFE